MLVPKRKLNINLRQAPIFGIIIVCTFFVLLVKMMFIGDLCVFQIAGKYDKEVAAHCMRWLASVTEENLDTSGEMDSV